jgi:hypothetical protein
VFERIQRPTPLQVDSRVGNYDRQPDLVKLGSMQRALFALGIVISLVGLAWPWISKLPLGRLPGDILIERPGFRFFLPITTMIVISLLISLILMLFRK